MKLVLVLILLTGCAAPMTHGIPNFATVEHGIYRGGQPTPEGWHWLQANGVKEVLKLNKESEASDLGADLLGLVVHGRPVSTGQQFGTSPLSAGTFERNLPLVQPGTFVHCQHGQDRTGLQIAVWRVRVCGWTCDRAETEMLALGFHKDLCGLWDYWKRFKANVAAEKRDTNHNTKD